MRFDEKIAMVTGGASGIGRATVMEFARSGATVICADVNAAKGEELKKEASSTNLKIDYVAIDMSNSESPQFIGRVIAALAVDPDIMKKSGRVLVAAQEAIEYGIQDIDGKQPRPLTLEDF